MCLSVCKPFPEVYVISAGYPWSTWTQGNFFCMMPLSKSLKHTFNPKWNGSLLFLMQFCLYCFLQGESFFFALGEEIEGIRGPPGQDGYAVSLSKNKFDIQ